MFNRVQARTVTYQAKQFRSERLEGFTNARDLLRRKIVANDKPALAQLPGERLLAPGEERAYVLQAILEQGAAILLELYEAISVAELQWPLGNELRSRSLRQEHPKLVLVQSSRKSTRDKSDVRMAFIQA